MATKYALPALPYAYDALEPHISSQIMTLHHTKHHQTYINNLNATLDSLATATSTGNLVNHVALQAALIFNAGGHINHSLFWENLAPAGTSPLKSGGPLDKAIQQRWGSLSGFQDAFGAVLLGIKGSGWGWLVQDEASGTLDIVTTKDQDVVPSGKKPLFGIDMWEHAYYLQYLNDKGSYVKGVWQILNWNTVETRFATGKASEVFGDVAGLLKGKPGL